MPDSGYGFGDGYGYGEGYGYGDGHGFSGGYGDGNGDGHGYGDGDGDSDNDGVNIGKVGYYVVELLIPWPYAKVGCQVHSLDHWREHWRELAERHDIDVDETTVQSLLDASEAEVQACSKI